MALQANIKEHLDQSTDETLLNMLDKPSEFIAEAMEYAEVLLRQRGRSELVDLARRRTHEKLQRIDDAASINLSDVFLYKLAVKSLQRHSSGIIFAAFYNVAVGLHGVFNYSALNWLLVGLGIGCFFIGIRCAQKPVPRRLLESGLIFLFASIWNLILVAGGNQENLIYWIGMLQSFWGGENILIFFRTWRIPRAEPSATNITLLDEVTALIKKTTFTESHALIVGKWKAIFAHTGAVFVTGEGAEEEMLFAAKAQMTIVKARKHLLSDQYAITLRVHKRKVFGHISGDAYRRLESWKRQ
jgi:hypothetical protein